MRSLYRETARMSSQKMKDERKSCYRVWRVTKETKVSIRTFMRTFIGTFWTRSSARSCWNPRDEACFAPSKMQSDGEFGGRSDRDAPP